jgi:hypothetical protein
VLTGQDIDKKTGKGVVAPGPADFASLFVDGEIDPGTLQGLGHEPAGDACTGDDNPKFSISHHASQDRPHPREAKVYAPRCGCGNALANLKRGEPDRSLPSLSSDRCNDNLEIR